jgi:hypothetical protein
MLNVGTDVVVDGGREEGKVVGYAIYTHSACKEQYSGYIVELKNGFFNGDHTIYASMIVVHPDNLKAKEE